MSDMPASPYDKEDDGDIILKNAPSPRPKDAATLILVRPARALSVEVLMGKRSGKHSFMPDKYVFPGGRVDPHDGRIPTASELHPASAEKLTIGTRRRARAFALTAIRETFEETGLIVGQTREGPTPKLPADWCSFFAEQAQPSLYGLRFIGRAVTPPYRPKRFDARFFMADARDALIDDRPPVDGAELSDLQWVTLDDAMALDLPSVTRFMLGEIAERVGDPSRQKAPPFLRWTRSGHKMERL